MARSSRRFGFTLIALPPARGMVRRPRSAGYNPMIHFIVSRYHPTVFSNPASNATIG